MGSSGGREIPHRIVFQEMRQKFGNFVGTGRILVLPDRYVSPAANFFSLAGPRYAIMSLCFRHRPFNPDAIIVDPGKCVLSLSGGFPPSGVHDAEDTRSVHFAVKIQEFSA
jgi:hypothetical protein